MKIFFFPVGSFTSGGSRIRGLYMSEALAKLGAKTNILNRNKQNIILDIIRTYIIFPFRAINYDIIYFQKTNNLPSVLLLYYFNLLGKLTVFDIEDYYNLELRPRLTKTMIKKSKVVIVGNHTLLEMIRKDNPNSYFLPTCVDTNIYNPSKRNNPRPVIGWMGHGAAHQENIRIVAEPLNELSKKHDFDLLIVGTQGIKAYEDAFKDIKNATLIANLDWQDRYAVPNMLNKFDIGMMPLLDNQRNAAKGLYKSVEYMAMSIPVVASPVGETTLQVEEGKNGFLARDNKEWVEKLEKLLANKKLREKLGRNGRKKAEEKYDLDKNAQILFNILKEYQDKN